MANKRRHQRNRIPVRFVDEESLSERDATTDQSRTPNPELDRDAISAEEIGSASSYEDETEVQRRIDRGAEQDDDRGRERADDADQAGGPPRDELPERREDQDRADAGFSPTTIHSPNDGDDAGARAQQPVGADASTGPLLAELVATRAELRRIEVERADLFDKLKRRQADFENYRKRTERERVETYGRLVGEVASKLLPVQDNLRRALDAEASVEASESEEFRHFLHGVELIFNQLGDVLEALGVQPVPAIGQRFDPHIHEAIATEQTDDVEPETVVQEIVRGYRLGEKLLRPAMVKVAIR